MLDLADDKPWKKNWRHIENIGGGGQGTTSKVQCKKSGTFGCLKLLNNNRSVGRRGRFRREVTALETVSHGAIPRVLDHNTDEYKEEIRLFVVTEYVPGDTLSSFRNKNELTVENCIELTVALLDVLIAAHDAELVHRDIKPDNILVREASSYDLVLVDFGLSYVPTTSFVTPNSEQQLGNRFLNLPELQTLSSDKRSPVSDVTQVCGILYFLISGLPPETLRDGDALAPHQRPNFKQKYSDHNAALLSVFDRGFRPTVAERWR